MLKWIYFKCGCGRSHKVPASGSHTVEAKTCTCGAIMDRCSKGEYDKLRGYDVIKMWKKDMIEEGEV